MQKSLGATVAIVFVAGLAALLFWYLGAGTADPVVPSGGADGGEPAAQTTPPSPRAERAEQASAKPQPGQSVPTDQAPAAPPPPRAEEGRGELVVRVVERATRTPLDAFRTLLRTDGPRGEAEGRGGEARLAVPLDRKFELAIEAEGYVPSGPRGFEVASAERTRTVTIELDRAMRETGVLLSVRDALGAPQAGIELTAWALGEDGARKEPPLWQRVHRAADGQHKVPDLVAGPHHFELLAIDANGDPLPLLAKEVAVHFRGGEQIPLQVQLEAGALVRVTVRDGAGTTLGTEVLLRLRRDDTVVDVRWRARGPGGLVVRRGGLPVAGEATLERAVPPGRYVLEVARGTAPTVQRDLVLAPGDFLPLEIVLP